MMELINANFSSYNVILPLFLRYPNVPQNLEFSFGDVTFEAER